MPNRLLIADHDPRTTRVLEVSLRGAGFDVTPATTGAAAWVSIEQQLPKVIIAATDLAAIDGFELCARVRGLEGGREVAFVLLGEDDSLGHRIKSIEAGADDYLLKPPYVQEVVSRVRAIIQRREREVLTTSARAVEAFAGRLADLGVVDLLQLIADSRRSGIVHLRGPREAPATIYFRQGQVVDAEVGHLSGLNAISRLFSWTDGSFEVQWKSIRRPDAVNMSTPQLVLEGMKRLDERNRLAGGLPDLNGLFEVNYRVLAERLSEIPDEVNAVLRLFDGVRTLAHVVEDCPLPDPEAMAIAIRLRDQGIIRSVAPRAVADRTSVDAPPPAPQPPPGAEDVTVVRRVTSLGIGSGPVQQSFAESVQAMAVGPAAGASPDDADEAVDDVDEELPPHHHAKTDPGLGVPLGFQAPQSAPASAALDAGAVPAAHWNGESIGIAADGAGLPGVRDDAPTAPLERAADIPHEAATTVAPSPDPAQEVSDPLAGMDPSLLRTQRGIGPFAGLLESEAATTVEPVVEAASGELRVHRTLDAGAASQAEPAPEPGTEPPETSAAPGPAAAAAPEPAEPAMPAAARTPVRMDATMRVNLADDTMTAQEALDELGVPGWKRGARIVTAVLAAGALTAVLVHKLHGGVSPSVATRAGGERGAATAPAAVAPRPPTTPAVPGLAAGKEPEAPAAPAAPPAPAGVAAAPGVSPPPAGPSHAPIATVAPSRPGDEAVHAATTTSPLPAARTGAIKAAAPPADFARQLATCRSQFLRDRLREAQATCAAALEANPGSADALTMMAHVELNRGHLARANELAQKAVEIDPNQADAYVIMGGVHQDSGRNAQAKIAYKRYLKLAPHGRYADELRSIVGSL